MEVEKYLRGTLSSPEGYSRWEWEGSGMPAAFLPWVMLGRE